MILFGINSTDIIARIFRSRVLQELRVLSSRGENVFVVDCLAVVRTLRKVSFSLFSELKTCFNLIIFPQSYSFMYRDL